MQLSTPHRCHDWSVWSYRVRLQKPLAVLGHHTTHRKGWIVGRRDPLSNHWNYGEIAPLPSFHGLSMDTVYADIIDVFKDDRPPETALVQTVLDVWNCPKSSGSLKINTLLDSVEDIGKSTPIIKLKLGRQTLSEDMKRFERLQKIHPHIIWRLDCNRQWTLEDLHKFWTICDPSRIEYIEDPLRDPAQMIHTSNIPLALDESLSEYTELLDLDSVVAAIIKPTLHKNWQDLLDRYSVRGVISSTFEGSLGIWGLAQLAMHHLNDETHGLGTLNWFAEECVQPTLTEHKDLLRIPKDPPNVLFSQIKWEDGV